MARGGGPGSGVQVPGGRLPDRPMQHRLPGEAWLDLGAQGQVHGGARHTPPVVGTCGQHNFNVVWRLKTTRQAGRGESTSAARDPLRKHMLTKDTLQICCKYLTLCTRALDQVRPRGASALWPCGAWRLLRRGCVCV